MAVISAALDSNNVELIFCENHGGSWQQIDETSTHVMFQDGCRFDGWGKDRAPQEASDIAGIINISAALDTTIVDAMKDAINFNSNTTLSLQYL